MAFLCDFDRIEARCKIEHRHPLLATECVLLHSDVALRHWCHLRNIIQLLVVLANTILKNSVLLPGKHDMDWRFLFWKVWKVVLKPGCRALVVQPMLHF